MDDDRSTTDDESAEPLFRRGAWGRLAVALVPVVALSGLVVAFAYRPGPDRAWWSVASIAGGDLAVFRDLHRWGGELLVVAAWLHLFRVFMVGAYQRLPGWALSVTLTVLVVASAASGWALRFDAGAARAVGDWLGAVYVLHVVVLPAAMLGSVWWFRRTRSSLLEEEPAEEASVEETSAEDAA